MLDGFFKHAAGGEDEVDGIASGALSAGKRRDVVCRALYLRARVGGRDGEADFAHDGKVDDVVAYVGEFVEGAAFGGENLVDGFHLVRLALVDVFDAEVMRADGDGLRLALGDEAELEAGEAGERYAETIVRVEAFDFDTFAVGSGHDGDVAVGEDAVDVEEEDFDAAGAGFCSESFRAHLDR